MKLYDIILENISGDWGSESPQSTSDVAVKCLRSADIVPIYQFDYSGIPYRYVSKKSMEARRLRKGDIVIEKSGGTDNCSTGRPIYISASLLVKNEPLLCSNFCSAIRLKKGWNPTFVYYYLRLIHDKGIFFNFEGKTSGIHNLDMDAAFKAIDIPDISYSEQERVAKILTSIDRKIALNRKINAELEQMAKELYDYWFVQFDFPNAEGKPYKSSGGKMVYNPQLKRDIPEGWEVGCVSSCCDANIKTKNRFIEGEKIQYLETGNITKNHIVNFIPITVGLDKVPSRARKLISSGDIIISTVRPNQCHYGIVYHPDNNMVVSTGFSVLTPIESYYSAYLYQAITQEEIILYLQTIAQNAVTSYPSINDSDILNIKVVIPSKDTLIRYENNVSLLFLEISNTEKENKSLTSLRDQLLPLLMNGQVKIK